MQELEIFVFKQRAVADSRDVARAVDRPHKQLMRSIQTIISHLDHNKNATVGESNERIFAPVKYFIPSTYIDEKGEERACYLCTRLGCDLIANKMTGEKGTLFTAAYVSKFRAMEEELTKRELQRAIKAPVRRALTDAIRDSGENERMHGHAFAAYTNLIYKAAVGKTATQLRKEGGKDALQMLDAENLAAVTKREAQVCTLLDCGMEYNEIRAVLTREKGATQ